MPRHADRRRAITGALGESAHAGAWDTGCVIPTAILAGLVLGLWLRWWAVPIVAAAWAVVIVFVADPTSALGGVLLGAANALVGMLLAVGLRRLFDLAPTGDQPNQTR